MTCISCLLLSALLAAQPAWAATWFALDTESAEGTVEVDLASLRSRGEKREMGVRIVYEQPRRQSNGPLYRSVLATLEVQCGNGQSLWRSASFHQDAKAEEAPVATENYGNGAPAHQIPALLTDKTWAVLRRSACTQPRTAGP